MRHAASTRGEAPSGVALARLLGKGGYYGEQSQMLSASFAVCCDIFIIGIVHSVAKPDRRDATSPGTGKVNRTSDAAAF